MVQFVTVSMVGGTIRRKVIHRESFQSLGPQPPLAAARCSSHRREEVSLDNAFALIEGHPAGAGAPKGRNPHSWERQACRTQIRVDVSPLGRAPRFP